MVFDSSSSSFTGTNQFSVVNTKQVDHLMRMNTQLYHSICRIVEYGAVVDLPCVDIHYFVNLGSFGCAMFWMLVEAKLQENSFQHSYNSLVG